MAYCSGGDGKNEKEAKSDEWENNKYRAQTLWYPTDASSASWLKVFRSYSLKVGRRALIYNYIAWKAKRLDCQLQAL